MVRLELSRYHQNRSNQNEVNTPYMKGTAWCCFLMSFIGILFSVGLANYLIDPYGRYGTNILGAHRIDSRSWVVSRLRSLVESPNVLLFGSSRCLPLNPKWDKELLCVNVSLYAGAIEDHYCILRFAVEELGIPVRIAVIGLEPDLLLSSHPIDPMLKKMESLENI